MEKQFLYPREWRASSPGRLATALFLVAGPLLYALAAIWLPQDANWDLRNYHWYNAYAFLGGRFGFDLLPSQVPFFYNPLIDVPFYLLATHAPPRVAVFCLAFVQGLNFPLLHALAKRALPEESGWTSLALALLGVAGGGTLGELGRTFYDNVLSLGILGSLVLALDVLPRADARAASTRPASSVWAALPVWSRAFVAGLPAGIAMGLKQPTIIYGLGLCLAFLPLRLTFAARLRLCLAFGCGCLLGLGAFSGFWMWHLWRDYGNPLFPYFNEIFKSPFALPLSLRDSKFVPMGWSKIWFAERIVFNPLLTGEVYWQDLRIAIWWALMLALALALLLRVAANFPRPLARPLTPEPPEAARINIERYLIWTGALSYLVWLPLFAIYRYLVPLEMLAPILIVLAARRLWEMAGGRVLALGLFAGYGGLVFGAAWTGGFGDANSGGPVWRGWMEACCGYRSPWPALALAPLIALVLHIACRQRWSWRGLALLVCLTSAVSVRPADWGFVPWSRQFASARVEPPFALPRDGMILMTGLMPFSDVVASFAREIPVLRIASNFSNPDQPTAMNRLLAARIEAQKARGGHFFVLYNAWEEWEVARDLAVFGLAPPAQNRHTCHVVTHNLFAETLYICPVAVKTPVSASPSPEPVIRARP